MRGARSSLAGTAAALLLACLACEPAVERYEPSMPKIIDTSGFHPHVAAAMHAAREATLHDRLSAERWGALGMLYHAHELMADAGSCYEIAARLDPEEFRWPYLNATRHDFGKLEPERKLELLLRARELNPRYAPIAIRIGDLLMEQDRIDEAGPYYEEALAAIPSSSHALLGLGRIALAAGEPEKSRAYLEEARWRQRHHTEVYSTLVRVYSALGLPRLAHRAAALAKRVEGVSMWDPVLMRVRRESLQPDQMRRRAGTAIRRGDYEQALELLRTVVEVDPDDADARVMLGRALVLTWRDEEGVAELERANEIESGSVDVADKLEDWRADRIPEDRGAPSSD